MRVLVTGAGGFIGSHLTADQLRRGREVTALDLNLDSVRGLASGGNLHLVEADFTDPSALEGLLAGHDVCFHLASLHLETDVAEERFWKVNVLGTRAFLERCHRAGVKRFVYCSSVGVYGDVEHPPADEETEPKPDIAYERSKLGAELAIREYVEAERYPVVVVRPAWVYGPGCPRTLRLFRTIKKGRFFFVGDGSTLRHPVYIDDMLAGFELAAAHPAAPGGTFIIAGPRAVTIRELTDAVADRMGVRRPAVRLPKAPVWAAAYALEGAFALTGRDSPISRRSLKFFTGNTAFSIRRAQETLGFEPQVELADGLARTFAWYLKTGLLEGAAPA